MKSLIQIINEEIALHEIGDGSANVLPYRKTYDFNYEDYINDDIAEEKYVIDTKTPTQLTLDINSDQVLLVNFGSKDKLDLELTHDHQTLKLMTTIVKIVKDSILEKYEKYDLKIKKVVFSIYIGDGHGDKRKSLYFAYMKRAIPNSTIIDRGNFDYDLIIPDSFYNGGA